MNRRGFLKLFGMAVAGVAIDQAIPLGRVWSFPSKIIVPKQMPLVYGTPELPAFLKGIPYFMSVDTSGPFMGLDRHQVSTRNFRIPMRFPE